MSTDDLAALYRDALTAIREALDIPYAATVGWDQARAAVLDERLTDTVVMLDGVLDADPTETIGGTSLIAHRVAYLRERLAAHPPTGYITHDEAHAALAHGATWAEAVAEPRACTICGPGCCAPVLGAHHADPHPAAGRTVASTR